jgi:hypothetical protein
LLAAGAQSPELCGVVRWSGSSFHSKRDEGENLQTYLAESALLTKPSVSSLGSGECIKTWKEASRI